MPTLRQYRQAIARELGRFQEGTASPNSTTDLIEDNSWPVRSTIGQDTLYQDMYLYRPEAVAASDKVRVVKTYDPSQGRLMVDLAWTNSPAGEKYELHTLIEPETELKNLINEALKRCMLVAEFSFVPANNRDVRHGLASVAPWLTESGWVRSVGMLSAGDDRDEVAPVSVRGRAYKDGNTVYLECGSFDTNTKLYVKAIKPAYNHCRASGGSFGDKSGLSMDADEAVPAEDWVTAAALVEAWRRYGHILEATNNQRLLRDRTEVAAMFSSLTAKYFAPPSLTLTPIMSWGPA